MLNIALFNQNGEKLNDLELNENVFGIEPNNQAIFDVVLLQRASLIEPLLVNSIYRDFTKIYQFSNMERNLGDRRVQDVLDRVLSVHHSGAVEELSLVLLQEAMTSRLTRKLRILH